MFKQFVMLCNVLAGSFESFVCFFSFRFLYHFSAGSAGNVPFEEKYLSLVVNRETELAESSGTFEVLSSETDQVDIFTVEMTLTS